MDHEAFQRDLKQLFVASGWCVQEALHHDDGRFDLLAEKDGVRYAIEIKFAREARRELLEGQLASAILRARFAAHVLNARPLAIVCAPSISDSVLRQLDEFAARFGEKASWGALDASGLVLMHGDGLESLRRERRNDRKPSSVPHRHDPFSDRGQWMAKVVLSHRLPPELRLYAPLDRARIDKPIVNAMELARVAVVSVAHASRFVASMREDRFLVGGSVLRLIREGELLERWRSVLKRRPAEIRARWLFSPKDSSKHLDEVLRKHPEKPGERACLGLFAACDRLGFRFVSGVAPHVYLEKISAKALQRFGFRLAEPGESADAFVREPHFPESVFRGSTKREGVPVADVLQCWLDVADDPARGEEMAAHLFDRVIRPSLLEGD